MNNLISRNGLCYQGKVDLYLERDGKQFHFATCNEGMAGMSELFTRAVLGYKTEDYRPWYVDLRTADNESMLFEATEVRAATFDTIKGEWGNNAYMNGWRYPILDALLTAENIVETKSGLCYLYLLAKNRTILARVPIIIDQATLDEDTSDIPVLKLSGGINNNILVRWALYLSNRTTEDN